MTQPAASAAEPAAAAEAALRRAEWQGTLFAARPRRTELLKLAPAWPLKPVRLRVWRNQAFEFVASAMAPFLAYAGYDAAIEMSDYDDTLSFALQGPADVELIWLDFARYGEAPAALAQWLGERIAALRHASAAPILIADWASAEAPAAAFNARLRERTAALPATHALDQAAIAATLGPAYHDARAARMAGMALSDAACIETARQLGLCWLPAALAPRLKVLALDLDGTLYDGVLGEDGPHGIRLSPGHAALQRRLIALKEDGLLLALVSRNEPEDVARLFAERGDFPLRLDHFSAQAISWQPKAQSLAAIAQRLRIGLDAVLFVDDNPGELSQVASAYPEVRTLHAAGEGAALAAALRYYPGLFHFDGGATDALRARDLAAASERDRQARAAGDPEAYLRSLKVRVTFALNPPGQRARLAELSAKTNQFNCALARLAEPEVARRLAEPQCRTVAARLTDRLSDSGVILALFARREGATLHVDELCISCRALGRGLEDLLVAEALRGILAELPAERVAFRWRTGPRNAPAREWLARYAGAALPGEEGTLTLDATGACAHGGAGAVILEWKQEP